MNLQKLEQFIRKYGEIIKADKHYLEDVQHRADRINFYQSFNENSFLNLSEEEFTVYIGKLWSTAIYGNKKYFVDKMIASNGGFSRLKSEMSKFLYGKDDFTKRWDLCIKTLKYFGPASMSELLSYLYPNEYVIANSQVIKALEILDCNGMPHYNYQFSGKAYENICNLVKEVAHAMQKNNVQCENLLAADYFLWEIARESLIIIPDQSTNVSVDSPNKTEQNNELIHNEIIEKIVQIGILLGFDAKSECKVAKGAVVDVVWSVNIGNMGRVMYIFEVQSKGSIDSLILNLQKASNNKAVQAVVAVSDAKQLLKIRDEAEAIKHLEIKYWNYMDVITAFDSLSKAHNIISGLGLVPQDFVL